MKIAIVTACPSGVANSIIAAGLLQQASKTLGWEAYIECHSTVIAGHTLSEEEINKADLVILAANGKIDMQRFVGKKVYQSPITACTSDPVGYLKQAAEQATELSSEQATRCDSPATASVSAKKIVAITACPTGVAHTFMAAEALEAEATRQGHQIKVETRGSVGAKNQLTEQEIAAADLVIIAADIDVPLDRFNGKKLYKTSTGLTLKKTAQELSNAFAQAKTFSSSANSATNEKAEEKKGVYKHLMTGVSHMLPVVVAGGLIIALSFVFGIEAFKEEGTLAAALMQIGGGSAFALMIPVLAGYIAFSIADRPGLAPGLIGGMLASSTGAGFLGGIVAGFLAGYSAKFIADKVQLPQSMAALKPILIIPFIYCQLIYRISDDLRRGRPHVEHHERYDQLPKQHGINQRDFARYCAWCHDVFRLRWPSEQSRIHLRRRLTRLTNLCANGRNHGGRYGASIGYGLSDLYRERQV